MHILVTNDDGPPSPVSSPYIHTLVRQLTESGHTVSVILPHTQRSWISKAHIIGQTVTPTYYTPSATSHGPDTSTTSATPTSPTGSEWILIDGTPASCVQIGVHHFFQERGAIDLVVSGPNYGRNTTAVFALSSGTMGAAMEAAVCGKKAVAVSYAFFSRNHDVEIIEAATRRAVGVIEMLAREWPEDRSVDLYSVNVPLVAEVEQNKAVWTDMLQNYWRDGSCFQEVEVEVKEGTAVAAEGMEGGHKHKVLKWTPKFAGVYKSVEEAKPGNDGWAVQEGLTSVTPLKANFFQAAQHLHGKELVLSTTTSTPATVPTPGSPSLFAIINYDDPYVHPLILRALQSIYPTTFTLLNPPCPASTDSSALSLRTLVPDASAKILQIMPYEALDFDLAKSSPDSVLLNSYMIRKALIRKHYLAFVVRHWVAKNPGSILATAVVPSDAFEVDYAEFLDDALIEAFDLRQAMDANMDKEPASREWWILKPGMSDRGQGIQLFSTQEELQGIFDAWAEDELATDDEDDAVDNINTSHLRHFVAQKYIHPPLLPEGDDRKFHIRTYVACVGRMTVYVYDDMLALSAGKKYVAPWTDKDLDAHLTNTCRQETQTPYNSPPIVRPFEEVIIPPSSSGAPTTTASIKQQIREITGDLFEGAARVMGMHFAPMANAFEVFGVDFMVAADGRVYLLEVNSFPDFRQSGEGLVGVVEGFWRETLRVAVGGFFGVGAVEESGKLVEVRRVVLGA